MNRHDLLVLDTVDTADYMDGNLSDEGAYAISRLLNLHEPIRSNAELDIPAHLVPPNPDDSDSTRCSCSSQVLQR